MKMEKDAYLENLMREYFDGTKVDNSLLVPAKNLLAQKKRTKRPFHLRWGAAVSFACVLIIAVVSVSLWSRNIGAPDDTTPDIRPPAVYTASSLNTEKTNYSALNDRYPAVFDRFAVFETSSHVNAEYYAYTDKASGEIMYAEIRAKMLFSDGMRDAVIRVEFADGATYEGFHGYYELENQHSYGKTDVFYETHYIDAEWVSSGYFEDYGVRWFIDVSSPAEDAIEELLGLIFRR
ncbi:MAG: hypothetical protein DBX59_04710 [Bacillota bacterium]|nr:MAG: hypothetical protein DBX59_04710 [Bacillota bacterium]